MLPVPEVIKDAIEDTMEATLLGIAAAFESTEANDANDDWVDWLG